MCHTKRDTMSIKKTPLESECDVHKYLLHMFALYCKIHLCFGRLWWRNTYKTLSNVGHLIFHFFWQSFLYSTDQRKLNLSAMLLARSGIFSWTNSLYSCKLYMSTRQTWQATCYWNHSGQHHRLVFATHVLYLKVAGSRALSLRCNRLWLAMVNDQTLHSHNCLVSELTVLEQGVMMSWWLKKNMQKHGVVVHLPGSFFTHYAATVMQSSITIPPATACSLQVPYASPVKPWAESHPKMLVHIASSHVYNSISSSRDFQSLYTLRHH